MNVQMYIVANHLRNLAFGLGYKNMVFIQQNKCITFINVFLLFIF
jgi:hypothetical protein